MALLPGYVRGAECSVVGWPVFPDPFSNDFPSGQQLALLQTKQVIARGSCGSPVAFYKRVNPVESPQRISRKHCGMTHDFPVFVDNGKEPVHVVGDFLKVGRVVIPDVDRLLAVASSKLRNVRMFATAA